MEPYPESAAETFAEAGAPSFVFAPNKYQVGGYRVQGLGYKSLDAGCYL